MENQNYEPQNYESQNHQPQPDGSKDGMATAILVLGIVSICCCAPAGIVSLVLGLTNRKLISPEKQGMCTAGIITSIIGIALWVIGIMFYLVIFVIGTSSGYGY